MTARHACSSAALLPVDGTARSCGVLTRRVASESAAGAAHYSWAHVSTLVFNRQPQPHRARCWRCHVLRRGRQALRRVAKGLQPARFDVWTKQACRCLIEQLSSINRWKCNNRWKCMG